MRHLPIALAAATALFVGFTSQLVATASASDDKAIELDAAAARLEEFAPQDLDAMANRRGTSRATAEYAMRLESAVIGLEPMIEGDWGDAYAGMWLSTGSAPGLTIWRQLE